jgi:uncharacterized protein YdaU (DUF1376 family)
MAQPFMQLYVADYLADTTDLTCEEHGAYLLLLLTMWRHGAKLPNDPQKLARIIRVSPKKWAAIWAQIGRFFVVDGDTISNKRLTREHQKAEEKSESRADAGRKGGQAKALKDKDTGLAKASFLPCHSLEPEPDNREVRELSKLNSCPFSDFWAAWPNKVSRKNAEAAWAKLSPADRADAMRLAVPWFNAWRIANPQASPIHAATFLNAKRWQDELPQVGLPNTAAPARIFDLSKYGKTQ